MIDEVLKIVDTRHDKMKNNDDYDSFDGLWKEAETYTEHLYNKTFEEIIKTGYEPKNPKIRSDIFLYPIVFDRLLSGIPKLYKISFTENLVFGSKLGLSILQHDERIKEIIYSIEDNAFKECSEFEYIAKKNTVQFSYATQTMSKRRTVCSLDWVIEAIKEQNDKLCMDFSYLYVICYLLGLEQTNKIPQEFMGQIIKETNKFWDFIEYVSKTKLQ